MAKVKNKVNTASGNGSGTVSRPKRSIIGKNNVKNTTMQVMNTPRTNDKVKRIRKYKEIILNNVKKKLFLSNKYNITKQITLKNKNKLKMYNNILKNELMIEDSKESSNNNKLNNNNLTLLNQNRDEIFLSLPRPKLPRKINKNRGVRKTDPNAPKKKRIRFRPVDKTKTYICDHCKKQFHSKCSLRRHIGLHFEVKCTHICKQCNKGFRKRLYLAAHIKRQHPNWEKHYMCAICDKPFVLKENLTLHLASHARTETTFKCVYCKERFADQHELVKHEKQHLISGLYDCIVCELSFDCRNKLTNHFKTHLRVKDYICQHCGKEFLRMNSMRRHVQVCHAGIRLQCPICKKNLKGHLTEHMRTHEKKRPHECPDCGQKFTQSTQLTVHRRSHTGVRPYVCRVCERAFSHSNALLLHIRRHTGEKPFACAMCPLAFSQLPHMKAHMKNIHNKMNPYRCLKCKQFFKLKIELENHVKGCTVGDKVVPIDENSEDSIKVDEDEPPMNISRMRYLLALLLTMIATKDKLKYLGFNKRLIDDLLVESLEGMGYQPCKDESLAPLNRLKKNIKILLKGTVPKEQMEKFKKDNKSTEELLELLTNEKKNK